MKCLAAVLALVFVFRPSSSSPVFAEGLWETVLSQDSRYQRRCSTCLCLCLCLSLSLSVSRSHASEVVCLKEGADSRLEVCVRKVKNDRRSWVFNHVCVCVCVCRLSSLSQEFSSSQVSERNSELFWRYKKEMLVRPWAWESVFLTRPRPNAGLNV